MVNKKTDPCSLGALSLVGNRLRVSCIFGTDSPGRKTETDQRTAKDTEQQLETSVKMGLCQPMWCLCMPAPSTGGSPASMTSEQGFI